MQDAKGGKKNEKKKQETGNVNRDNIMKQGGEVIKI